MFNLIQNFSFLWNIISKLIIFCIEIQPFHLPGKPHGKLIDRSINIALEYSINDLEV